jgi:guanosine-3',5'-bis(diphosphate) 3'-pyrophosphohydrolase
MRICPQHVIRGPLVASEAADISGARIGLVRLKVLADAAQRHPQESCPGRIEVKSRISGLEMVVRAAHFAAHKHSDQRRKDAKASPYINHPLALAEMLTSVGGVRDPVVLAAALLHDTIEDTQTTAKELTKHFGPVVAGIVVEVTDDKRLEKTERKRLQVEHAATTSRRAKLVKLADKICNLTDILGSPPADWSVERKLEYFDWARAVVDQLGPVNRPMLGRFRKVYGKRPK